jgi:DNA-binding XRE family transcriptional regulator
VSWDVRLWEDLESWALGLDDETYHLVAAAITRLESEGPALGRPTADRIKGSRHHNMKELRPGSAGRRKIRILFAFDPKRRAILLVAGDKAGRWKQWYDQNIPLADERFDEWLDSEMSKSRTVSWSDVRARRPVDDAVIADHVERMKAEERAYRLREIREEQGVTQKELADRMSLTQPTISALESGDLDRSGLATLRAYVEALGGTVEVTATFGSRKLVVSSQP